MRFWISRFEALAKEKKKNQLKKRNRKKKINHTKKVHSGARNWR